MTLREQLTLAIEARLTDVAGLPTPVRGEDDPRTAAYALVDPADQTLTHFLALLDEGAPPREGCSPTLGAGGVLYDWNLKLIASYAVRTTDPAARKTQRDAGVSLITSSLLPAALPEVEQRQLGGLANWMWVEPVDIHNDVYDGDVQLGVARIPITIWFSAINPSA